MDLSREELEAMWLVMQVMERRERDASDRLRQEFDANGQAADDDTLRRHAYLAQTMAESRNVRDTLAVMRGMAIDRSR